MVRGQIKIGARNPIPWLSALHTKLEHTANDRRVTEDESYGLADAHRFYFKKDLPPDEIGFLYKTLRSGKSNRMMKTASGSKRRSALR
jgi:hypothetical protein